LLILVTAKPTSDNPNEEVYHHKTLEYFRVKGNLLEVQSISLPRLVSCGLVTNSFPMGEGRRIE
jgi:hypothetical protein